MTQLADAFDLIAEGFASAALALREKPADSSAPLAPLEDFEDTPAGRSKAGGCPVHGIPWTVKPAGTSKATGAPYNAFWHCEGQNDDGTFCRQKPTPGWVKAHPAR